jgi:heme/copper-type cytochrome/quinol oxidase subunit 2
MDSGFSHSSLIIWVIAIQVLILGLAGVFLLHRKFRGSAKSESRIKTFSIQHTRRTSIFGGILMGVIFIGISIYFVVTLDRSGQHKPTSPISKRSSSPQPEPSPHEKKDPFEQPSREKAELLWNSEIKYGDSRVREITRKAIQISSRFREPGPEREKRDMEGCLRDILHNPMVSDSAAETLEELNRTLLAECMASGDQPRKGHSRTINDLFKQEKICLLAFPNRPS